MSCFDASAQPYQQSTVFILNLDYLLCEIGYCCTLRKTRNAAHRWVDPHTIDSLFLVFPSDIWCKISTMNINSPNLLWGKTRWFQGFFMVSGSKHLSSGGMEICKSDSTLLGMVSKTMNWGGSRTYESMSICCLWQRTVCTSADKIWRPTRVHAWSHFAFNFYQWLAQLVYLSHRSYFTRTMLSFTTLTPVSETYISTVFNKDLKTVAVLDPL